MATLSGLDLERPPRFGPARWVVAILAALLIGFCWLQILDLDGIEVAQVDADGVPVTLLVPPEADGQGVVVAHGFAGSATLMRSTALAMARQGLVVAVPDLSGHGANPTPLARDDDGAQHTADVLAALDVLAAQPDVDADRLGVLGHSMGSGAVLRAGIEAPERIAAVVAVSPTDAPVTAELPENLLLLAGELEGPFVANAERLLAAAGGPSDDLAAARQQGQARELTLIRGVEHLSILFSPTMHDEAARWLTTPDGAVGTDTREAPVAPIAWWLVHLLAVLALWRALAPVLAERVLLGGHRGQPVVGLLAGTVASTVVLAIVGTVVPLDGVLGMLIGPAFVCWLALAGVVWLRIGHRPGPPGARDLVWGAVALGVLVAAFGALAPQVWLPWFPSGARVLIAVVAAAALLPWAVAWAATVHDRRGLAGFGWWVLIGLVVTVGVTVAAGVVEGLGFLTLIAPTIPAVLGLVQLVTAPLRRPWAAAIALAGFLGWTVAVLFPLG
ncbi:MAG: alpha/beta fold hydrolase [Nitriliruptoraceae bacterium]|nr:alpha/beta fold hydrolase [Nitriliruptoraceae bacterium]